MPVEIATIGATIFEAALKKIGTAILADAGKRSLKALSNVKVDFGDHLRQSYEKCYYVRTVLNREESVELLSIYVNLKFARGRDGVVDDYDVVEDMFDKKRVIIAGGGGGGKTIFMKYLWISMFDHWRSTVPLFIELRRFNEMTSENFTTFLFRSIVGSESSLAVSDFERALKEGAFTLILDGFDEINIERRNIVELAILNLGYNYPKLSIVLSSRPDEKFNGWQSFIIYKVLPMEQRQVVDLITKLDYNAKIKKKFIQRIKSDLYSKHQSFLSSPLLATMMLLTFDQFADIPEKIYLFYEQAFDTLFAKHDATKEAYKRKSHTGLPIDNFKKLLAYFCIVSYYEEKHEYTETDVRKYIDKAAQMGRQEINSEHFLLDLKESVCILQKEGLVWTYTHRSFQEYFSAYCLSNLISAQMRDILPALVGRVQDNVLSMCYDMNKEQIEDRYIIPVLEEIVKAFPALPTNELVKNYIQFFNCILLGSFAVVAEKTGNKKHKIVARIFFYSNRHYYKFASAIRQLYRLPSYPYDLLNHDQDSKFLILKSGYNPTKVSEANKIDLMQIKIMDVSVDHHNNDASSLDFTDLPATIDDLLDLSLVKYIGRQIEDLTKLLDTLQAESRLRKKNINEIFSIKVL